MLHGKPLIAWAIESSLESGVAPTVYVSTESPEIAEIAVRYGAVALERNPSLSGDQVPLDPVIVDAADRIEQREGPMDVIITIQATCPLISPSTIRTAIQKLREEPLDTVLTAVEDKALRWGVEDGHFKPLFAERLNRQQMEPVYRETGGVIACRRDILKNGSRVGGRVGLVIVDRREAVDIDELEDWTAAESHLSRRQILFHLIGNTEVGLGHAYRALTLVEHLTNHDVRFIVPTTSALAASLLRGRHYEVQEVAPHEIEKSILEHEPDILINDILDTEESFIRRIRDAGIHCINFEDLGPGGALADLVINAMYEPHPRHPDHILSGPRYACLRSEFYSLEPRPIRETAKEILVLFGGTDPGDLTVRTLGWLNNLPGELSIQVVLGMGYSGDRAELERLASASPHGVRIDQDVPVISSVMQRADLAVTSAGRTVFELASLGVPMIVMAQNDLEMTHVFARSNRGIIFLGRGAEVSGEEFLGRLGEIRGSRLARQLMQDNLLALDIRRGIDEVVGVIDRFAQTTGVRTR